jgi:hypothetical protein
MEIVRKRKFLPEIFSISNRQVDQVKEMKPEQVETSKSCHYYYYYYYYSIIIIIIIIINNTETHICKYIT